MFSSMTCIISKHLKTRFWDLTLHQIWIVDYKSISQLPIRCSFAAHNSTEHRVLLEKLSVAQLVKKFPAIYGTRRLITVLIRLRR
jgi:hypothetical protein